jgi:predicted O-methyltransferase YrrM
MEWRRMTSFDTSLDRNAHAFLGSAAADVISRLEDRASADERWIGAVSTALRQWDDHSPEDALATMTAVSTEVLLPVARDVGQLLFTLAMASNAQWIVEYGTSMGMSTIYLAGAARRTGGRVIGTEASEKKLIEASRNLADAELDQYVDLLPGDARQTLSSLEEPVDFLLLDGWVPLYLEIFQLLEPRLAPNGLVVCDTVRAQADRLAEFYEYVDGRQDRYMRTHLPVDDGVDLIVCL